MNASGAVGRMTQRVSNISVSNSISPKRLWLLGGLMWAVIFCLQWYVGFWPFN